MARPAVPEAELRAIDYVPADAVGFQHLPQLVRYALGGVLIGTEVATDAEPPAVKRRPDGTYYQQATGWWASGDRYVIIDGRRRLAPATGRGFKAITGWKIDGMISYFPTGILPVTSRWPLDRRATTVGATGRRRIADDPLDVLPRHLAAPVRGADASASHKYQPGWAEETIVAALAASYRVRVLKAQRTATSRPALETADWCAVSLDAPVAAVQALGTDVRGQVRLAAATYPAPLRQGASSARSIRPPG
jgi:hypothetical protein